MAKARGSKAKTASKQASKKRPSASARPPSRSRGWRRPERDFHALSLRDLLAARDAYHVHLTRLDNVVATAIGLYRIRDDDPDANDPAKEAKRGRRQPRTLANTVVRPWSWPCIVVFVDAWIPPDQFGRKFDQIVPPRLYLPDGLAVPTCVVHVERTALQPVVPGELRFPVTAIGGGYPVLADVQQTTHIGSIGCLVSDGDLLFALTNRHVAGDPGRELYTLVQGQREPLGVSSERQLRRLPFEEVYPGWKGAHTHCTLDAGLIEVEDAKRWTSQAYGIGEFGPLYDVSVETLTLDLIGKPVSAFGAASGHMSGEVQALFYRYRSVGGSDFVADLLIGRRRTDSGPLGRYGNSGTVWFLEDQPEDGAAPVLRPLALHWGAQSFREPAGDATTDFALATLLSTVCRELDVDVVNDLNVGLSTTWGKLGHYKIGAAATGVVTDKKLKTFVEKNLERIAFDDADLMNISAALRRTRFTALADVPDIVWKERGPRKRGREGPNHFADMDQRSSQFGNKTLLDLCDDASKLDVTLWMQVYESLDVDIRSRGLLPFRVWQLYQTMVDALGDKTLVDYLCAAGVLAHYVADACQPLHTSYLHDGDPDTGEGEGVHGAYQTQMVDRFAAELIDGVNKELKGAKLLDIGSGRDAAFETVELMRRSIRSLPPKKLIQTYTESTGRGRVAALWKAHGAATIARMADGATLLASIWQGAWKRGGGNKIATTKLVAINKNSLRARYDNDDFAPSVYLSMLATDGDRLRVKDDS